MKIQKGIFNVAETGLILFVIYVIAMEYSGKFSDYRFPWDHFNSNYIRIVIDLVIVGIFCLRIFQIVRRIIKPELVEVERKQFIIMIILYSLLIFPDLYTYSLWFYYTQITPAGLRLVIYLIPVIFWIYQTCKKKWHIVNLFRKSS